ncbi:hypothetical protein K8Q94_00220 [Candidatus Nomurabacteria bacterium]|nr:hypothetical protein [Candidatus Nomurabacteria bacterium]
MLNKINKNLIKNIFTVFGLLMLVISVNSYPLTVKACSNFESNCSGEISSSNTNTYNNNNSYNNYNNNNVITANPAPVLYSVSPNEVSDISGNMAVVLTGANFVPNSIAEFNNSYRSTSYVNSGKLTMILNSADVMTPGKYVISVFSPMPGGGTSNGVYFTVKSSTITGTTTNTNNSNVSNSTVKKNPTTTATKKTNTTTTKSASDLGNTLSANVLSSLTGTSGSACGFLPSSFLQWLLLIVLIIVLIILIRKFFYEDKFHNTPLKHH